MTLYLLNLNLLAHRGSGLLDVSPEAHRIFGRLRQGLEVYRLLSGAAIVAALVGLRGTPRWAAALALAPAVLITLFFLFGTV